MSDHLVFPGFSKQPPPPSSGGELTEARRIAGMHRSAGGQAETTPLPVSSLRTYSFAEVFCRSSGETAPVHSYRRTESKATRLSSLWLRRLGESKEPALPRIADASGA